MSVVPRGGKRIFESSYSAKPMFESRTGRPLPATPAAHVAAAGVEQVGGAVVADGPVGLAAQVRQVAVDGEARDLELLAQLGETRVS